MSASAAGNTNNDAHQREAHAAADNQSKDLAFARAERDADADFANPAVDSEEESSVEPEAGEEKAAVANTKITSVVNRGWPEAWETTLAMGRRSTNGSPESMDATAARAEAAISAGFPRVRTTNLMMRPRKAGGGPDWASGTDTVGGLGLLGPVDRTSPTMPTIRIHGTGLRGPKRMVLPTGSSPDQ